MTRKVLIFNTALVFCILLTGADAAVGKKGVRPGIYLDPIRQFRIFPGRYHDKRALLNSIPPYAQGYDQSRVTHSFLKPFIVDYPIQSVPLGVKIPFKNLHNQGLYKFPVGHNIPSPVYGARFPANSGNFPVHLPPSKPTWPTDCHHVLPSAASSPLTPIVPAPANPTVAIQIPTNVVPTTSLTPIVPLPQPPVSFIVRPIFRPVIPIQTQILTPVAPAPFIPRPVLKPIIPVQTQILTPVGQPAFGPAIIKPGNSVHTTLFATYPKHQLIHNAPVVHPGLGVEEGHGHVQVAHHPVNFAHGPVNVGHVPIGHAVNGPIDIAHGPLPLAHVPINFGHGHFNVVHTPINFGQPHNFAHVHPAPGQIPLNFGNLPPTFAHSAAGHDQPPVTFAQPSPPGSNIPTRIGDFPVNFGNFPVNIGNLPSGSTQTNNAGSENFDTNHQAGQLPYNFDQSQFYAPNPSVQFLPQDTPPKPFFIPAGHNEARAPTFSTESQGQGINPSFSTVSHDQGSGFVNDLNSNADGNNIWTPMTPAPEGGVQSAHQYPTQPQYSPQGGDNNSIQPQNSGSDSQDFNSFNSANSHGYHYRQNLNQAFHEVSHQQNFHQQAQQQYLNSQDPGNLQHQPQFPQTLPEHPLGDRPVSEAFQDHISHQQRLPLNTPLKDFVGRY